MTKRVLSVGQCGVDHAALRAFIEQFRRPRGGRRRRSTQALAALRAERADLVLVNRKLDADYSDGLRSFEDQGRRRSWLRSPACW